jgi:hypothetical protein
LRRNLNDIIRNVYICSKRNINHLVLTYIHSYNHTEVANYPQ